MRFSARVGIVDINPYVEVPEGIVRALHEAAKKARGPVPVRGKLNGRPFRATLVLFRGLWRIYLNSYMRADAGVGVGDEVTMEVEFDPGPRTVPVPGKFADALSRDKNAAGAFGKLAPSHRREILRYLNSLKSEAALERNVRQVIARLKGGRKGKLGYLVR